MHHRAKFRQNLSIRCKVIAFFLFIKVAAVHYLGFVWGPIWTTREGYLVVFITVQNVVAIDVVVSKIQKFEFFTRLA